MKDSISTPRPKVGAVRLVTPLSGSGGCNGRCKPLQREISGLAALPDPAARTLFA